MYVFYQESTNSYPVSIGLCQDTVDGIQKTVEKAIPSSEFENNKVIELGDGIYAVFNINKSDYQSISYTKVNSFEWYIHR